MSTLNICQVLTRLIEHHPCVSDDSLCRACYKLQFNVGYRISSIRRRGYYLFRYTNSPSTSVVTVVRNHSYTCAHAAFTSHGYYSRAAFISFKSFGLCSYYSRAATIQGWHLFKEIQYVHVKLQNKTVPLVSTPVLDYRSTYRASIYKMKRLSGTNFNSENNLPAF